MSKLKGTRKLKKKIIPVVSCPMKSEILKYNLIRLSKKNLVSYHSGRRIQNPLLKIKNKK